MSVAETGVPLSGSAERTRRWRERERRGAQVVPIELEAGEADALRSVLAKLLRVTPAAVDPAPERLAGDQRRALVADGLLARNADSEAEAAAVRDLLAALLGATQRPLGDYHRVVVRLDPAELDELVERGVLAADQKTSRDAVRSAVEKLLLRAMDAAADGVLDLSDEAPGEA